MTKSLEQFKNDTLGGSFGNPGTDTFKGQCVSYVRLYMEQALGLKTDVWGNAVDYWSNPKVLKNFDKVSAPRNGDIGVYGNDLGNWTGPEGHIFIYYNGQMLNQNYGGSLKVSIDPIFNPGFLGYLRFKGGEMLNSKNDVDRVFLATLHEPTKSEADASKWYGLDVLTALDRIRSSPQWLEQNNTLIVAHPAALEEIRTLEKSAPSASEADQKIQAIKDALGIK